MSVWNFNYTGDVQIFKVPFYGEYLLEVWGGQGGRTNGGKGGYSKGKFTTLNVTELRVHVGGQGGMPAGGWNGGGLAAHVTVGGGGGATDIRTSSSLNDRIIVAGGGGGGQAYSGGFGGGLIGGNGISGYGSIGYGGTQSAGGAGPRPGTFGIGGNGVAGGDGYGGGAGGGGWYGGGGASSDGSSYDDSGGGGGSSYIGGVQEGSTISGNSSIPSPSGGTQVGNTGHGFARITLIKIFDSSYSLIKDDNKYYFATNDNYNYKLLNYNAVDFQSVFFNPLVSSSYEKIKSSISLNEYVAFKYLNAERFIPLSKFKKENLRIIKIIVAKVNGMLLPYTAPLKLTISTKLTNNVASRYNFTIKESIVKPNTLSDFYIKVDNSAKIKAAILCKDPLYKIDTLYGENMEEIKQEDILLKGFTPKTLGDYTIPFKEFSLVFSFLDEGNEIKKVTFYEDKSGDYKKIKNDLYEVYYDASKNKTYIKFKSNHKKVIVNKTSLLNDNLYNGNTDTLQEF